MGSMIRARPRRAGASLVGARKEEASRPITMADDSHMKEAAILGFVLAPWTCAVPRPKRRVPPQARADGENVSVDTFRMLLKK